MWDKVIYKQQWSVLDHITWSTLHSTQSGTSLDYLLHVHESHCTLHSRGTSLDYLLHVHESHCPIHSLGTSPDSRILVYVYESHCPIHSLGTSPDSRILVHVYEPHCPTHSLGTSPDSCILVHVYEPHCPIHSIVIMTIPDSSFLPTYMTQTAIEIIWGQCTCVYEPHCTLQVLGVVLILPLSVNVYHPYSHNDTFGGIGHMYM